MGGVLGSVGVIVCFRVDFLDYYNNDKGIGLAHRVRGWKYVTGCNV